MPPFAVQRFRAQLAWNSIKAKIGLVSSERDSLMVGLNLVLSIVLIKKSEEKIKTLSANRIEHEREIGQLKDEM